MLQFPVYELQLHVQQRGTPVGNTGRKQVQTCWGLLARQLGKPSPSPFFPSPPAFAQLSEPASCSHRAFLPLLALGVSPMAPHFRSREAELCQASDELSSSSHWHCLTCLLVN